MASRPLRGTLRLLLRAARRFREAQAGAQPEATERGKADDLAPGRQLDPACLRLLGEPGVVGPGGVVPEEIAVFGKVQCIADVEGGVKSLLCQRRPRSRARYETAIFPSILVFRMGNPDPIFTAP